MGYCLIALKVENAISKVLPGGNSPKFIWMLFLFLLNILEVPHWRFSVLKFYSTTEQVACGKQMENHNIIAISLLKTGSNSKQISHHNNSGKGVSLYCWYCQNEI